ncbi:MAG: hypothetical protein Q7U92_03145, partial [Bradyrhizobium sp.]|nr:hypothetical protein [Bradyrhizobium sp.]
MLRCGISSPSSGRPFSKQVNVSAPDSGAPAGYREQAPGHCGSLPTGSQFIGNGSTLAQAARRKRDRSPFSR